MPPAPVIESCPAPTCPCAAMPEGLDIDQTSKLQGTVPFHKRHLIVNTSGTDWPSRLEDDQGSYVAKVKKVYGRDGRLFDPQNTPLISAAHLPKHNNYGLLFFPNFLYLPRNSTSYFNNGTSQPLVDDLMDYLRLRLDWFNANKFTDRNLEGFRHLHRALTPIDVPVILICGHGARDSRCGILGPILQKQFEDVLDQFGLDAIVGQISHVGGHKFAGNVIVYVPPEYGKGQDGVRTSALAARNVWYGRVTPERVQGVVKETLIEGRVVGELFRGQMEGMGELPDLKDWYRRGARKRSVEESRAVKEAKMKNDMAATGGLEAFDEELLESQGETNVDHMEIPESLDAVEDVVAEEDVRR